MSAKSSPANHSVVKQQMRRILSDLNYDFSQFTLAGFIGWLEQSEQRVFHCHPATLPAPIFGTWNTTDNREEYILFDAHGTALHQTHIILHEISHWLLNHPTHSLSDISPSTGAAQASLNPSRGVQTPTQELEAEILSSLILNEVQRHRRQSPRVNAVGKLHSFFKALDATP